MSTVNGPAQPPPLRFALACFGSALCFLALGSIGLLWAAPDLAAGLFPASRVVAVVHLFTLGWITLSMIAALHHFLPVVLHTSLLPPSWGWAQLVAFDLGLVAFTAGELAARPALALAGASLLAAALLGIVLGLVAALLRLRPRGRTTHALLAASTFLAVTLALGFTLAGGRGFGWLGAHRLDLLVLHIRVALIGWVLLVVLAVGQRLLPMFLLTRAPGRRSGTAALLLVGAGALASIVGYGRSGMLAVIPILLGAVGLLVFLGAAARTLRRSQRGQLDPGMRLAFAGLGFLALAAPLAPYLLRSRSLPTPQGAILLTATVVLGGLTMFVAGHYLRLVPFLVWSSRWARVPAGPRAPEALYRAGRATAALVLLAAGAGTILVSIGLQLAAGARAGAASFAIGVAVLARELLRVMAGRPR